MTVESIELYPTCDIHLLLHGPNGPTPYQLQVRDYAKPSDDRSALIAHTKYTGFDAAVAEVSATGLITGKGVGETFCRIRHTDPLNQMAAATFVSEIVARIRVHDSIEALWCGNNRATLLDGQTNYVLSVYARFDDGTVGDITSHPYLTFKSSDVTRVEVGSANDLEPDPGRLSALGETGATPVAVTVSVGLLTDNVPVFVQPAITTPRPLLERVQGAGPVTERRNILFVADGFTAAQRPLFRRLVVLLKDELFNARLHSPYDILKDRFNVWTIFDPSPEEGTTCGDFVDVFGSSPFGMRKATCVSNIDLDPQTGDYTLRELVRRVGLPDRYRPIPATQVDAEVAWASTVADTDYDPTKLHADVAAEWLDLHPYHIMQARDSRFGTMNGLRYGDRRSRRVDPNDARPLIEWYEPSQGSHVPLLDRRRVGHDWNMRTFVSGFLDAVEPASGTGEDITDIWIGGGLDKGLVVFLVNSALYGGVRGEDGISVCIRQNTRFTEVQVNGDEVDHSLPDIEVLSLPVLIGSSLDKMVSVLAHELAHAFELGDEYEGGSYTSAHHEISETDLNARATIEADNNLTHHFVVAARPGEPGIVNIKRAKWHLWHRIARCSVLGSDPELLGGGRMRVHLPDDDRAKWDRPDMHNIEVYLRTRTINGDGALLPAPRFRWSLEGPLKILQIEPDGSYTLAGTSSESFKKGDILYLPELHDGKPLTIFHPNVLFALEVFGEPFALKTDKTKANTEPAYPPAHALVPDFDPRHPAFVVGLYDGGGTYNSRVYRTSGFCKMRSNLRAVISEKEVAVNPEMDILIGPLVEKTKFVPFCYACRYVLVNTVDPTLLEGLEYPV